MTRHVPRPDSRYLDPERDDEHDDEEHDRWGDMDDIDEEDEDVQKRLCPKCPTCNMQDNACLVDSSLNKHCDPIMTVFLSTDPDAEQKITPVAITVGGEARAHFDLALVASKLGLEMEELQALIERERNERDRGAIDMGIRIGERQMKALVDALTKIKAEGTLAVSETISRRVTLSSQIPETS